MSLTRSGCMYKYFNCCRVSLLATCFLVLAYAKRPHRLALTRFGIRIIAATNDNSNRQKLENLADEAYKALILLEQYDNEILDSIKKQTRIIILLFPAGERFLRPNYVPTGVFYFLNVLRYPVGWPTESMPIEIAGFLARQVKLANLKGCVEQFDKVNGAAITEQCRMEHVRMMKKLKQAVGKSQTADQ
jgi:hypothetical protein